MRKAKQTNPPRKGAAEVIIAVQSGALLLVGLAGITSAGTIVAGFKAITNAQSAVTLITAGEIKTETEAVPIETVEGVVNNFHIVCATALIIGGIVAVATAVRLLRKLKNS